VVGDSDGYGEGKGVIGDLDGVPEVCLDGFAVGALTSNYGDW
jgi:hypothetical protein